MGLVRKTGGSKEFHDSGEVEPLEPYRVKKIKEFFSSQNIFSLCCFLFFLQLQ